MTACTCGGIDAVPHATDHAPDCAIWAADNLLDAIGDLYGCGDIRFKYELEDARTEAVKARAALLAENELLRDALAAIRAAWNAHMETCPPAGRPEIAQASWDDLERWRNAPSGTASAWDAEQEADHAD